LMPNWPVLGPWQSPAVLRTDACIRERRQQVLCTPSSSAEGRARPHPGGRRLRDCSLSSSNGGSRAVDAPPLSSLCSFGKSPKRRGLQVRLADILLPVCLRPEGLSCRQLGATPPRAEGRTMSTNSCSSGTEWMHPRL
jgi:hypothetical protein